VTASNGHIADVLEGIVESANDRGVKVGGEWRNVSRFHPVELPDRGARPAKRFGRGQERLKDCPLWVAQIRWVGDTRHALRCPDVATAPFSHGLLEPRPWG
jgi:hypothetical protein